MFSALLANSLRQDGSAHGQSPAALLVPANYDDDKTHHEGKGERSGGGGGGHYSLEANAAANVRDDASFFSPLYTTTTGEVEGGRSSCSGACMRSNRLLPESVVASTGSASPVVEAAGSSPSPDSGHSLAHPPPRYIYDSIGSPNYMMHFDAAKHRLSSIQLAATKSAGPCPRKDFTLCHVGPYLLLFGGTAVSRETTLSAATSSSLPPSLSSGLGTYHHHEHEHSFPLLSSPTGAAEGGMGCFYRLDLRESPPEWECLDELQSGDGSKPQPRAHHIAVPFRDRYMIIYGGRCLRHYSHPPRASSPDGVHVHHAADDQQETSSSVGELRDAVQRGQYDVFLYDAYEGRWLPPAPGFPLLMSHSCCIFQDRFLCLFGGLQLRMDGSDLTAPAAAEISDSLYVLDMDSNAWSHNPSSGSDEPKGRPSSPKRGGVSSRLVSSSSPLGTGRREAAAAAAAMPSIRPPPRFECRLVGLDNSLFLLGGFRFDEFARKVPCFDAWQWDIASALWHQVEFCIPTWESGVVPLLIPDHVSKELVVTPNLETLYSLPFESLKALSERNLRAVVQSRQLMANPARALPPPLWKIDVMEELVLRGSSGSGLLTPTAAGAGGGLHTPTGRTAPTGGRGGVCVRDDVSPHGSPTRPRGGGGGKVVGWQTDQQPVTMHSSPVRSPSLHHSAPRDASTGHDGELRAESAEEVPFPLPPPSTAEQDGHGSGARGGSTRTVSVGSGTDTRGGKSPSISSAQQQQQQHRHVKSTQAAPATTFVSKLSGSSSARPKRQPFRAATTPRTSSTPTSTSRSPSSVVAQQPSATAAHEQLSPSPSPMPMIRQRQQQQPTVTGRSTSTTSTKQSERSPHVGGRRGPSPSSSRSTSTRATSKGTPTTTITTTATAPHHRGGDDIDTLDTDALLSLLPSFQKRKQQSAG